MLEIGMFTPNEIDEAIEGLDGLQKTIVPILQKANYEGMAEQDIRQFQRHIMLAKHALIAMGDFLESKMQERERNEPMTCEGCEWCKIGLRFECYLVDDDGHTASIQDHVVQTVIADFCPICGKRLEVEHDGT